MASTASSATDWTAKEIRWKDGIDVNTAAAKDLTDYLLFKVWQYKENEVTDEGLWSIFGDDFKDFDPGIFSKISPINLRRMFNYLRKGGVYVQPKKDRVTYAQLLHDILQEEQPDVWTQEKLDEVYNELADGKFFSVKLNNTIKRGLDFKISSTYTPQPGKQGETPPPVPSGAGHPSLA